MAKTLELDVTMLLLPITVDLRKYCSPIENLFRLGSCTAHEGIGIGKILSKGRLASISRLPPFSLQNHPLQ